MTFLLIVRTIWVLAFGTGHDEWVCEGRSRIVWAKCNGFSAFFVCTLGQRLRRGFHARFCIFICSRCQSNGRLFAGLCNAGVLGVRFSLPVENVEQRLIHALGRFGL